MLSVPQASLYFTDRTPFEKKNYHVAKIQLYDLHNKGDFDHVRVHVRYMYLLFPNLLGSGADKLTSALQATSLDLVRKLSIIDSLLNIPKP